MIKEDFIECSFPDYIINIAESYINAKPDKDIEKGLSSVQFNVSNIAKFRFEWEKTSARYELVLWPNKRFYIKLVFAYESDAHYCIDTDRFSQGLSFEEVGSEFLKRLKSYTYYKFIE